MTDEIFTPVSSFDDVRVIQTIDAVKGGHGGAINIALQALVNRDTRLKNELSDAGLAMLKRGKEYEVGDIAYSKLLPSWARLECVTAGTTGDTEPDFSTVSAGGVLLSDSTVQFIVDDVRDGTAIGVVVGRLYLPDGYVKANGATVLRADYPRLVALADKYNLWTATPTTFAGLFGKGDGSTTFVLPNYTSRFVEFTASNVGKSIAAGLPNITAYWNIMSEYNSCSSGGAGYFDAPWGIRSEGGTGGSRTGICLDASRSSAIYGASTTVQPPAIAEMAVIRY